jgi:TolA-binding protein
MSIPIRLPDFLTDPFREEKREKRPVDFSPRSTITPNPENKPSGVNILRIVQDNASSQMQELDEEIKELEIKVADLQRRRHFVEQLAKIAEEYHNE